MSKTTNASTAKKVEKKPTVVKDVVSDNKDDIIKMLMEKVDALTAMVNNAVVDDSTAITEDISNNIYDEPNPNKQIRIISLCYGELNLSTEPYGKGRLLSFSKFGESKTVLYSTLIDIVNNNRNFAEDGNFYILDKNAVYHLGLSDFYQGLLTKEIMDNIFDYSIPEIKDLLDGASTEQKDVLVRNIIDRIYNGDNIDLNKSNAVGVSCGIDIMSKVSEMKEIQSAMSKSKES